MSAGRGRRAALLVTALATGCGGVQPAEPPARWEAEADVPRQACELAGGAVRIAMPVPEDHALAVSPEVCMLVDERSTAPVLLSVSAIPVGDAGPEQLLSVQPDGVLRWALASGLFGEDAEPAGETNLRVLGRERPVYLVTGTLPDLGPAEVALTRVTRAGTHVVVMAVAPVGQVEAQTHLGELMQILEWN